MTRRILFRPEAEAELIEAADWYESRGRGLGAEFLRAFDAAISFIERHPLAYPVVFAGVRRAVLRKFPYSVVYAVSDDNILIIACIHGRRDPKRWQERI
jgi:plasmid stabilization system protein ParE